MSDGRVLPASGSPTTADEFSLTSTPESFADRQQLVPQGSRAMEDGIAKGQNKWLSDEARSFPRGPPLRSLNSSTAVLIAVVSLYALAIPLGVGIPSAVNPLTSTFRMPSDSGKSYNDSYDHMILAVSISMAVAEVIMYWLRSVLPAPWSPVRTVPEFPWAVWQAAFSFAQMAVNYALGLNGIATLWLLGVVAIPGLRIHAAFAKRRRHPGTFRFFDGRFTPCCQCCRNPNEKPEAESSRTVEVSVIQLSPEGPSCGRQKVETGMPEVLRCVALPERRRRGGIDWIASVLFVMLGLGMLAPTAAPSWADSPGNNFYRWVPAVGDGSANGEHQWRAIFGTFSLGFLISSTDPLGLFIAYPIFHSCQGIIHAFTMFVDKLIQINAGGPNNNLEHLYGDIVGMFLIGLGCTIVATLRLRGQF